MGPVPECFIWIIVRIHSLPPPDSKPQTLSTSNFKDAQMKMPGLVFAGCQGGAARTSPLHKKLG